MDLNSCFHCEHIFAVIMTDPVGSSIQKNSERNVSPERDAFSFLFFSRKKRIFFSLFENEKRKKRIPAPPILDCWAVLQTPSPSAGRDAEAVEGVVEGGVGHQERVPVSVKVKSVIALFWSYAP